MGYINHGRLSGSPFCSIPKLLSERASKTSRNRSSLESTSVSLSQRGYYFFLLGLQAGFASSLALLADIPSPKARSQKAPAQFPLISCLNPFSCVLDT